MVGILLLGRQAPVPGSHHTSTPRAEMSHHNGLSISPPRPRHTSSRGDDWRGTHSKAWAPSHVLGFLTVMHGVKDTTGVAPWISPMTHISILAWALQTVALPCLSRDIWPPSKSSLQTCHHFICNSGGLALLFWRPVTVELPPSEWVRSETALSWEVSLKTLKEGEALTEVVAPSSGQLFTLHMAKG